MTAVAQTARKAQRHGGTDAQKAKIPLGLSPEKGMSKSLEVGFRVVKVAPPTPKSAPTAPTHGVKPAKTSPFLDGDANARTVLTCVGDGRRLIPTRDPYDRAHLERDGAGYLLPAAVETRTGPRPARGKARMYTRDQMVAVRVIVGQNRTGDDAYCDGVSFDSCYDATHAARLRLAGVDGVGTSEEYGSSASCSAAVIEAIRIFRGTEVTLKHKWRGKTR